MGLAQAERDANLNRFLGSAAAAMAGTLYVELLTTNPSDETGTGLVAATTGAWTNYARQSIASSSVGWNAPAAGVAPARKITNKLKVDYGTATIPGAAPVIVGFAVYDAVTAGVFKGWGALASSQTINNGDPVYFNPGTLEIDQ